MDEFELVSIYKVLIYIITIEGLKSLSYIQVFLVFFVF